MSLNFDLDEEIK